MLNRISSVLQRSPSQPKVGLPPGSVVFTGEEPTEDVTIDLIDFEPDGLNEQPIDDVETLTDLRDSETVSWINVVGLHEEHIIERLGTLFGIHPLVQEDIVHPTQRPKLEEYDDHLYIVLKMIYHDDEGALITEQVSLILGSHYVITFQERPGDVFDPVRQRIRSARGRIRRMQPDYLGYAIMDVIIDHYFVVLEHFGKEAEDLEDEVLDDPTIETQQQINELRRALIHMRRAVWPVREVLSQIQREESPLIQPDTRPFIRDAYDHAVQVVDIVESLRDVVGGLTDLYMTALSNRMNEIMKVLTIIGTIFIPLTFIAGIYGMNFEYMPELQYRWAYPAFWIVIIVMAALLLVFFRRKDWI